MAPSVDQSSLDLLLQSNQSWCQLGAYETISKSQAADGKCLADHYLLLKALLDLQPGGQLLLTQVRSSVLKVCSLKPEVNQSQLKNLLWAGSRYDKVCCMLYHLRRAKRDPEKKRQLVAKTVPEDLAKVMELVNKLEDEPKAGDAKLAVDEPSDGTPPRRITGKVSPEKIGNSPGSTCGTSSKASAVKPKAAKAKAKSGVCKQSLTNQLPSLRSQWSSTERITTRMATAMASRSSLTRSTSTRSSALVASTKAKPFWIRCQPRFWLT